MLPVFFFLIKATPPLQDIREMRVLPFEGLKEVSPKEKSNISGVENNGQRFWI